MTLNTQLIGGMISVVFGVLVSWIYLLVSPKDDVIGEGVTRGSSNRRQKEQHIFLKIFGNLISMLGDIIKGFSWIPRDALDEKLTQAGRPGELSVDEFYAARLVVAVIFFLLGMYIDSEIGTSPVIAIGLMLLGFFYPVIWLSGVIAKRRQRIFRDLPDTLDMLRLSVDAGLDLGSAMRVVVERGRPGPFLDELEKVERDMALGRTRQEAFKDMAKRIAMTEINSFVLALIQADQLGASIGPVLKVQAEVSRTRRWQLAEAMVNKLPMKMLGPLVLLIFPASFIILFTPLIIRYMQSGV